MRTFYFSALALLSILFFNCTTDHELNTTNTNSLESAKKIYEFTNKMNSDSEQANNAIQKITINNQGRSYYSTIEIENDQIRKTSGGITISTSTSTLTSNQQIALKSLLDNLNPKRIPSYNAPSNSYLHGATSETFSLTMENGRVYTSRIYDAGNAPAQLKQLVEFIKGL